MLAAGINVALGSDSAPCNNKYDMFREMHLAFVLHGGVRKQAGLITAYHVLEFAMINRAGALGLGYHIASLELGKKADIVVVAPKGVSAAPWDPAQVFEGGVDLVATLMHCSGNDMGNVMIDRKMLIRGEELAGVNEHELVEGAQMAIKGIRE